MGRPRSGQIVQPEPGGQPSADVIAYPTLEGLFGSMDFCACDHCRSILSPAAYLVDLLHFIDQRRRRRTENPQAVLLRAPPGPPAPAADLREHQHRAAVHRRRQRDARVLHRQRRPSRCR